MVVAEVVVVEEAEEEDGGIEIAAGKDGTGEEEVEEEGDTPGIPTLAPGMSRSGAEGSGTDRRRI